MRLSTCSVLALRVLVSDLLASAQSEQSQRIAVDDRLDRFLRRPRQPRALDHRVHPVQSVNCLLHVVIG